VNSSRNSNTATQSEGLDAAVQSGLLTGLDALAEVSRQHGHIQQSTIADEFLNSEYVADPESSSPQNNQMQWTSQGSYSSMMHHGYATAAPVGPMSSTASLRMAEAALHALDPQLQHQEERRVSQEHRIRRELLVDYSHGQPPSLDDTHSRHSFVQYVSNQPPSPAEEHAPSPTPPNYAHNATQSADMTHSQRVFVEYTNGQHSPANEQASNEDGAPPQPRAGPDSSTNTPAEQTPETSFAMWDVFNPPASPMVVRKVRGAFAPDRRTAVKEVRKKGACLRCRMLKKSCDSGDPCKECAKLETARLWKGECVRTRLTKIFEIYSSGLFMVLSHHAVEAIKGSEPIVAKPGRIEISFFPKAGIFVTFPYSEGPRANGHGHVALITANDDGMNDKLTLGGRPLHYASRLLERHRESGNAVFEVSSFMNATLALAMNLKQRVLISKALELWVCTCILACKPSELQAFENPTEVATTVVLDSFDLGKVSSAVSTELIYLQLRRATEKCAEVLFKVIMIELEKSLIQRKQADNFETFIGTILLLRCVEQMCHLYNGLDVQSTDETLTSNKNYQSPYKAPPPSWPLDKPPHYFWQQGERFSDLLCNMLKLRKVIPKTEINHGVFVAVGEPPSVRQWFEAIQLRVDALEAAKARPFDATDDTSWEFRWVGKAFLKAET
jgi:hypothetical protein